MSHKNHNIVKTKFLWTLSLVWLMACDQGRAFKDGVNETKPEVVSITALQKNTVVEPQKVFVGYYSLNVLTQRTKRTLCSGDMEITLYDNFKNTSTGNAECGAFLKLVGLGKFSYGEQDVEVVPADYEEIRAGGYDPRLSYLKKIGDIEFIPHKPDMVGPIIQDPQQFADIDLDFPLTVRQPVKAKDGSSTTQDGQYITDSGTLHVKVIEAGTAFKPPRYPNSFNQTIAYEVTTQGFEQLPNRAEAQLFNYARYRFSTRPIALLDLYIESDVSDFQSGFGTGFFNGITGGLIIQIQLKEFVQLQHQ